MACINRDTRIYIYLDTSGSIPVVSQNAISDAINELKVVLQDTVYQGVDVNTRVFYLTTGWTNERWVDRFRHAAASSTNAVAITLIDESHPVYHGHPGDIISEPTAQYLADHAALMAQVESSEAFGGLVYGFQTSHVASPMFAQHLQRAFSGTEGYPSGLGTLNTQYRANVNPDQPVSAYYADLLGFLRSLCFQPERDRYGASISSSAGSLLSAVRAVPFDSSARIQISPSATLSQVNGYPFREATRQARNGPTDAVFFPRPRQTADGTSSYEGVTMLALMERVYPSQIFTRVSDLPIPQTGGAATAQAIINYVFGQWLLEYPWFVYAPVPDLRTRTPSALKPSDYGPTDGLVTDRIIRLRQSDERRVSMLAMLEALLTPFPSTQYFQASTGELVIRPAYGPDADEEPVITLADSDVKEISDGLPDLFQVRNRCTVRLQTFKPTENVEVLTPAWLQVLSAHIRLTSYQPNPASNFLQPVPADRLDLTVGEGSPNGVRDWPLDPDLLLADANFIYLEADGSPLITAAINTYTAAGTLDEAWTSPGDLTIDLFNPIPMSGAWVQAIGVRRGSSYSGNSWWTRWSARWNSSRNAIQLRWDGGQLEVNTWLGDASKRVGQFEMTLNGVSTAWAEGASISATFGVVGEDVLPSASGGDAIAESVENFGLVEETINIEGYGDLDVLTLRDIATGYVLENISPKSVREIVLGWKGSTRVLFDHRGRRAATPFGGQGLIVGVDYRDEFQSPSGGKTARLEEIIPGAPGSVDVENPWLLNDDGSYWTNDDGSLSQPA